MKNYFQVILKALKAVVAFATSPSQAPVTNSVPALGTGVTNMVNRILAIDSLILDQQNPISGFTVQKHELKEAVVLQSILNIRPVMSYAKEHDAALYNILKGDKVTGLTSSRSGIRKLKDALIGPRLTGVRQAIDASMAAITAAGITSVNPTTTAAMQSAINAFTAFLSVPRNKLANRKTDTSAIEELVLAANDYARTVLDPLVESFLVTNNFYYVNWFNNRKQIHTGEHHNRINATVVNEIGEPYVGVIVTVDEYTDPDTGNTYDAVSGNTEIDGTVTVEEFFPGNRTVTVSGDGIVTKTFGPFHFESGKAIDQVFVCEPSFENIPAAKTEEQSEEKSEEKTEEKK